MKILLIDPPFFRIIGFHNRYFPAGLAYIASTLQAEGYDALVYDADYNDSTTKMDFTRLEDSYPYYVESLKQEDHPVWREIRDKVRDLKPDIVGITVWTTFAASAFKVASIVKSIDKDLPVVMGGPHVSIKHEEVIKICPDVDVLVRGEGEMAFLELVRAFAGGHEKLHDALARIKGITYRRDGNVVNNPARKFIKELDSVPFPARDLLINKDSYSSEDMGLMMTSRGCPYSCSYCATFIWERKIRYRSIGNIIEEIKHIVEKYGTRQVTFKDDSFTVSRKRVMEFCDRLINEDIRINWECNTRVNLVDEELLRHMKRAGCNSIKVGIESGSERVLGLMKKGITFDQCREAARLFRKVGIFWTGYFMGGLPSETMEEVYETLEFMKELKPDFASFSIYEAFPGTGLYEMGYERGLVQKDRTLDDFYSLSPKYYYIKDAKRRIDTMSDDEFTLLEEKMKREFHKYNMGIPRLFRRARSRSSLYLDNPKTLFSDIKKLWDWL